MLVALRLAVDGQGAFARRFPPVTVSKGLSSVWVITGVYAPSSMGKAVIFCKKDCATSAGIVMSTVLVTAFAVPCADQEVACAFQTRRRLPLLLSTKW